MKISYSAIELYLNCPKKYYFSEVEKIKVKKSKEQIFGTLIHSALKFLHQPQPLAPKLEEVLDYFKERWQEQKEVGFKSPEEEKAYFEEGLRILRDYYQKNQPQKFLIVDLEKKIFAKIKEGPHPEAKEHVLIGIIDRIDKISDNCFEIIDYKTSRKMPSQQVVDHHLQLGIYALGFEQNWPSLKDASLILSLYFLKHSQKISTKKTQEIIENAKRKALRVISLIEAKKFPCYVTSLCDWCQYKKICPMWKHLYENLSVSEKQMVDLVNEYLVLKKRQEEDLKRIKKLREEINRYCDKKGIERIFAPQGYLERTLQERTSFDEEKLFQILKETNFLEKVLDISLKKLKELWHQLPEEVKKRIEKEALLKKEFKSLKAVFKKVKPQ